MTTRIGVIGYGYWGPNLVRNFMELPGSEVAAICDRDAARRDLAKRRVPAARVTADASELFNDASIDAIVVATPVASHHELALAALRAGKHVLVEKPLARTAAQCRELIDEARRANRVLLVDHTFLYTGAVEKIRELIDAGDLGEILYYDSVRVNLGLFQPDVDVLWDLAVHDLSILQHVLPMKATGVNAVGMRHVAGQQVDQAYLTLSFDAPVMASLHVNWLSPVKVRRTLIGGSRRMIVYDDLDMDARIRVFDRGIDVLDKQSEDGRSIYQMVAYRRTGDMIAPKLRMTEALEVEARHFLDCIAGRAKPLSPGESGLEVIRILEAASESLANQGQHVKL